jgi:hypothetical protein
MVYQAIAVKMGIAAYQVGVGFRAKLEVKAQAGIPVLVDIAVLSVSQELVGIQAHKAQVDLVDIPVAE